MAMKVGFIGLGIMGSAMAKNLLHGGYDVMVYNRTRAKTDPLAAAGARVAANPAAVANDADVIIFMLTGPQAIDAVMESENGLLTGSLSGKLVVNMSTVSPMYCASLADRLAQFGATFIDAPVSGSKKPAEDGTLVILAAGDTDALNRLEPLLLKMGKKIVYGGDVPAGSKMKMTVNLLLGIMMAGLCESLNFAQQCGLSTETVLEMVLPGPLGCGLFELKAGMLEKSDYPAQFPLKHMLKDLRFVLETADQHGAAVPSGHAVYQLYRYALGQQLGDADFAAIKKAVEALSDRSP